MTNQRKEEMSEYQKMVLGIEPTAKLIGPSGDGCHVEIGGEWFAYGNLEINGWKNAAIKLGII